MSDPRNNLENVIEKALSKSLKELHTALPAIVQSFDPVRQLVDVQPTIQRKIKGINQNLPFLAGVPIRYLKSGDFSVTFPILEGDHVLIIMSERSIDNWLESGDIQPAEDIRRHHLSDAFALPMMYPQPDTVTDFDPEHLQIKSLNGNSKITIEKAGNITIDTTNETTINTGGDTIINAEGNTEITTAGETTVDSPQTTLTGGAVTIAGTVSPTAGDGGFSCLTNCLFTGAVHVGNTIIGT